MKSHNLFSFTSNPSRKSLSFSNFHCLLLVFIHVQACVLSSPLNPLVLPLKTRVLPSPSGPKPASKLHFHRNVSLTVSLTVGTPPQNVTMVIDTGSELSWLRCNRTQRTPTRFDPTASKSYNPIPCSSPTCTTRTRDFLIPASCDAGKLCHATISYADSSSSEGNLAYEVFNFGGSNFSGLVFGCMDSVYGSNPDEDSKATGLLGMNRGSLSFVSQLGFSKFSYCISGSDFSGVLLLGDANFTWLTPLNYTPLVQIPTRLPYFDRVAYTVRLLGIKVSGKPLPIPESILQPDHTGAGQTMVDSGTQFTFLLGPVYAALKNEFLNRTAGLLPVLDNPSFVFQGAMDLCYRVDPGREVFLDLPAVTLMFDGAEMTVSEDKLLYRVPARQSPATGNDSVYCLTFGNSDLLGVEAYVIGHHHQQNVWMEFDLRRARIGLAQVRCDLSGQRLGVGR